MDGFVDKWKNSNRVLNQSVEGRKWKTKAHEFILNRITKNFEKQIVWRKGIQTVFFNNGLVLFTARMIERNLMLRSGYWRPDLIGFWHETKIIFGIKKPVVKPPVLIFNPFKN